MSLELSGQDWDFAEGSFAVPSNEVIDGDAGSCQEIGHMILKDPDWGFHIDNRTNEGVVSMWERPGPIIDDEGRRRVKGMESYRYETVRGPSGRENVLRVRERG
ncbi:MAG: hypothetical protein ACE5OO_02185 [Candidatus Bathyarchaeia archaeon]